MEQVKIKIGPVVFDHADYDADSGSIEASTQDLAPALAAV